MLTSNTAIRFPAFQALTHQRKPAPGELSRLHRRIGEVLPLIEEGRTTVAAAFAPRERALIVDFLPPGRSFLTPSNYNGTAATIQARTVSNLRHARKRIMRFIRHNIK